MANFLANLSNSGATSLVTAVGDAIDKIAISDEERKEHDNELAKAAMQHEEKMAALGLQEKQAELSDIASARENQSRVQESGFASSLAKNVHPLLAFGIMGLTFLLYALVIYGSTKEGFFKSETKDIVIYILGALTTVATQVVSYFFGSSTGSADKSRTLNEIAKKGV
ncbi:MAG TPA: hypothetical protein VFP33_07645 [Gallionella sp.]|nr:hypothetical protein [Gallionella sp.]